jgi:5-methylcytosine-specific restriction endonuclease McrA
MCCGASRESGDQIHVDHILPRSLFPEHELEFNNMAVLCRSCNMAKSNTDFTDWRNDEERKTAFSGK